MSIRVPLDRFAETAGRRGPAFVVTTGPDGRAHVSHQHVRLDGEVVRCTPGSSTLRNGSGGAPVVLLWPPLPGVDDGFSLLADGAGEQEPDGVLAVRITAAVLHRPAPAP